MAQLGAKELQDIFKKSLPVGTAFLPEEIHVRKTPMTPHIISALDDDEPIFSNLSEQNEYRTEIKPEMSWGMGPLGVWMRSLRSRSPLTCAGPGNSSASSSRRHFNNDRFASTDDGKANGNMPQQQKMSQQHQDKTERVVLTPDGSQPSQWLGAGLDRLPASPPKSSCLKRPSDSRRAKEGIYLFRLPASPPKRSCLKRSGEPRRTKIGITWSGRVDTVPITPYRNPEDAPHLWFMNGCPIECNFCCQANGDKKFTIRGAPGHSRFAQWQVICVDCLAKERLAEIGGIQIISFSTEGAEQRSLHGYMRKMCQGLATMQSNSPPAAEDTLVQLLRAVQSSGIRLPGCGRNANEIAMRRKALENAVAGMQDDPNVSRAQSVQNGSVLRRLAAASSSSSGARTKPQQCSRAKFQRAGSKSKASGRSMKIACVASGKRAANNAKRGASQQCSRTKSQLAVGKTKERGSSMKIACAVRDKRATSKRKKGFRHKTAHRKK